MAAYGSVPTLAADCGVGVGVTAGIVGKFNLSCKSLLVAVGAVTADTAETVGAARHLSVQPASPRQCAAQ